MGTAEDPDDRTRSTIADAGKPDRRSAPSIARDPEFGPRYRVLGVLGKGGMGEVYRAYDTELKGEVALKIVRGDSADPDASLARFRREIALARKVTNPNVLRVYDLAEHEGLRFLSMEYVDGEDLGQLMRREKRLSLDSAVAIYRQVCTGMAAAHAQGVVHRDLKPQNVLVDKEGRVHVADFGLARSIGESGLTASGAILGSPVYMSPEQVKGEPVDERSDIYSLGVMLYQLVAGEPPFQASTSHSVMEMRLHKKPRPLREARADAPAYLERIVARCLEIAPQARYRSVRDILAELDGARDPVKPRNKTRGIAGGITAVVIAAVAIAIIAWPSRHAPQPPRAASSLTPALTPKTTAVAATVLVMKIENHTGDPLFDGTLDLVVSLALRRSTILGTVAGADLELLATELAPEPLPIDDHLGQLLAARDGGRVFSVRGSIATKNAGFVLSLAATDTSDGKVVVAQTLDAASLAAVVPTVSRWAYAVRRALGEDLPADGPEATQTGASANVEADHELAVSRGMERSGNDAGSLPHLLHAVELDPDFALGHSSLAISYYNVGRFVDAAAQWRAVLSQIDHFGKYDRLKFLGDYYSNVTGEYDRAIASYQDLLRTWSTDMAAEVGLANAYLSNRNLNSSVEAGRRAAKDHPKLVLVVSNLVNYELCAGDFADAIRDAHAIIATFPRPTPAVFEYLALGNLLEGHRAEALQAYDKYEQVEPSSGVRAKADLALAESRLTEAAAILEKGIAADLATSNTDGAELKQAMLAETRLRRGDKRGALAAAAKVQKEPTRRFMAALVQLAVGDDKAAAATAAQLAKDIAVDPRAMAKLLDAETARVHGKPEQAILLFQEGLRITDMWIGHFLLGRAELDAGRFAEAYSELTACLARKGEGVIAFLDDVATVRYLAPVTYYLARAQEGLGSSDANPSYKAFLVGQSTADHDPLVDDARRRVKR